MKNKTQLTRNILSTHVLRRRARRWMPTLITGSFALWAAASTILRAECREGCDSVTQGTFLGEDALVNNTSGPGDTAVGFDALLNNTTGQANTAAGLEALMSNTDGFGNTATGWKALLSNTTGTANTGCGEVTLYANTIGSNNTATGAGALLANTTGSQNTSDGTDSLFSNTTGDNNTALGSAALNINTTGASNTATGLEAMLNNTTGSFNTANGDNALVNNTIGSRNIALGTSAGSNLTTGNDNIDIGNSGVAGEAGAIRIGTSGTQGATFIAGIRGVPVSGGQPVAISSGGRLGVKASSIRFKEAIKPMDKASEAILSLRPVTFRYKKELDPRGAPQFGLVAEDVAKVDPDLVMTDDQGKPFTVRYDEVNAMLLNEFLKEHRRYGQHEAMITAQQKQIDELRAVSKEQLAELQKISHQLITGQTERQ